MISKLRMWLIELIAGKDSVMINIAFDRPVSIYHGDGRSSLICGCIFTYKEGGAPAISVKPMSKFPKTDGDRKYIIN